MRRVWLVATALLLAGCGPAQLGPDREAFKDVDAFYTAVSLREAPRVDDTLARLRSLHAAGKLPESALRELERIGDEAKGGGWESAQARLGDFMRGQRR